MSDDGFDWRTCADVAAMLLFTVRPTDRALAGWCAVTMDEAFYTWTIHQRAGVTS